MARFILRSLFFVIILFALADDVAFSQHGSHLGIDLYLAGKNLEAIDSLSQAVKQKAFESNGEIWNYLGLAYIKTNDFKNAKKAFEKTVKFSPENSIYHSNLAYLYILVKQTSDARLQSEKAIVLDPKNAVAYYLHGSASLWDLKLEQAGNDADQSIIIDPAFAQGYILKSNVFITNLEQRLAKGSNAKSEIKFLKDAADILRKGVENCKRAPNRNLVENEFESVEAFYQFFSVDKSGSVMPTTDPEPGVTPLKILKKAPPAYTDSARRANIQGKITIAVIFGADGKVQHTLPLKRLGNGLDEQAINAARKIVFEPMTKDGRPISVVKTIEYTFSIY